MYKIIIIICTYFFTYIPNCSAKGFALLIGVDSVNPNAYTSFYNLSSVAGARKDVSKMHEILSLSGFSDIRILQGRNATKEGILQELNKIKNLMVKGDVFVFFYSGHGDTLTDSNRDEFPFTFDQAFVTYNKFLIDDELNAVWRKFPKAVKIYQIVDACYSGEMYRIATFLSSVQNSSPISPFLFEEDLNTINTCKGIDKSQPYDMYYIASGRKNTPVLSTSSGEGILVNDIYGVFNKLRNENKLRLITASDFFSLVCTGSLKFVFIKIHSATDSLKDDYLFKL